MKQSETLLLLYNPLLIGDFRPVGCDRAANAEKPHDQALAENRNEDGQTIENKGENTKLRLRALDRHMPLPHGPKHGKIFYEKQRVAMGGASIYPDLITGLKPK